MKKISILVVSISMIMFLFACGNKGNDTSESVGNDNVVETSETNNNEVKVTTNNEIDDTEPFDYLEKLIVDGDVFVKYNSASTTVINKSISELDKNDPLYYEDEMGMGGTKLLKTKISSDGDYYNIVFSWGPSADPEFSFYKDGQKEAIFYVAGLNLYIPGNGSIYVSGHTNNNFNERKKFTLKNGEFVEAPQAYYYVGLKTKTVKAITIYKNDNLTGSVANLPKDYSIEVLINKQGTDLYLIKTDFGLTGWVKTGPVNYGDGAIDGLFYAGD